MNCPRCKSTHIQRRGKLKPWAVLSKQRYECQRCGKWFSDEEKETKQTTTAKILLFDIETLPILGYAWRPWDTNIFHIEKDICLLSWSAKWLYEPEVFSDVLTPEEAVNRNDNRISQSLWTMLDGADVVIAHNGSDFDIKMSNTFFLKNSIMPPTKYQVIDTLTVAKRVFKFTRNSLDYITKYLKLPVKFSTEKGLWIECDHGNKDALKKMVTYNINDVEILEDVYVKLRPWIPNHPNMNLYTELNVPVCPSCGGSNLEHSAIYAGKYQTFRCNECKSQGRSRTSSILWKSKTILLPI